MVFDPDFPACAECQQGTGTPIVVSTVANNPKLIRLTFRCGSCGHEWQHDRDASVDLRPKADRRDRKSRPE